MKPAPFDYVRPGTLPEALSILSQANGDAKPIAGGQSLVPLLALRMTAPRLLVDITRLPELKGIDVTPNGVRLGALVRWRDIESDPELRRQQPLLVEAVKHIAHYQIRTRGTVGGSCAHADPAAEMPAIAITCDAEFEVASLRGVRLISACDFFTGVLTTALEPDELLIALHLPKWPAARRHGFQEFARRSGDFAIAGCALFWDEDQDGRCIAPHVGVFGVGDAALRLQIVEDALSERRLTPDLIARAGELAERAVEPQDDLHAPAAYRRSLIRVLTERALSDAAIQPATGAL